MVLVQILEGFHGFLEERKGNQSSPTEYKGRGEGGGGYIKLTGLIRWSQNWLDYSDITEPHGGSRNTTRLLQPPTPSPQ